MGIGAILGALDFARGKKTIYSIGIAAGVGALHIAARGVAEAIVPGNDGVSSAIDQAAAWGYGLSGFGTAYGLGFKVVRRRVRPDAAAILVAVLGAGLIGYGCASDPVTGERIVERDLCMKRVEQAAVLTIGCQEFSDEADRLKCEGYAKAVLEAARASCGFADDLPDVG